VGQLALLYGANDMGSLMIEENVVAEAGTVHHLSLEEIRSAISELGYTPRQRNVFYELLQENLSAPRQASSQAATSCSHPPLVQIGAN
jgi:cyclic dehypoxanthinyl futalosine synthase